MYRYTDHVMSISKTLISKPWTNIYPVGFEIKDKTEIEIRLAFYLDLIPVFTGKNNPLHEQTFTTNLAILKFPVYHCNVPIVSVHLYLSKPYMAFYLSQVLYAASQSLLCGILNKSL